MFRNTLDVMDPPVAAARTCPGCGLARLRRSRTRTFEKIFKPFTARRPHACTACGWRGWTSLEAARIAPRVEAAARVETAARMETVVSRRIFDPAAHTTIGTVSARPVASALPPSVASQLGNLAQSLAVHPATPRTLALVSAGRGEGTSTLTLNLGRYLASRNARVLVVDANPHHPLLHALAGVDQGDGLSDVVQGRLEMDAAIKPTAVPDLFVMTCGDVDESLVPLLPTAIRDRLLKRSAAYDYVLLDCPAVNVYEDAASIASICDGVILVVEGGRTLRQAARTAKVLLTRANCNLLGVFMNKRKLYIPQFLYDRL